MFTCSLNFSFFLCNLSSLRWRWMCFIQTNDFFPMGRVRQWRVRSLRPKIFQKAIFLSKTPNFRQKSFQNRTSPPDSPQTSHSSVFRKEISLIFEVSVNSSRNAFLIAWFLWKISQRRLSRDSSSVSPTTIVNEREKTIFDASTHFVSVSFCHWSVWHLIVFSRCVPRRGNEV